MSSLICLGLISAAGCAPWMRAERNTSTPTAVQPPSSAVMTTPTAIPTSTSTPAATTTLTPTSQPASTRTRYALTAELDYPTHKLTVSEAFHYTNHSQDALSELVLVVESNLNSGEFRLSSAAFGDGSPVEGLSLDGEKLTLPLTASLTPGESVDVNLAYTLDLPATLGVLSFGPRQVNASGWYPYVPPYVAGQGWLIHRPGAVGEYQVYELADFSVDLKVDGAPAGFTLAASGRGTFDQGWFHFEQQAVRNFTWSGSDDYSVLEGYASDIRVRAFVFSGDEAAGQASLDATVAALQLYSKLYGPYTHDSLTIVEADFTDGMEYDGLYFLGKEYFAAYSGDPASYLVTLSAHETAHQWWYAMVADDQALEPWLDEALCTYSERLFYENYYPDLVDWWWDTRVRAYSPQGWVNKTIYDFIAFRPYVNAVYLRGATFLEKLRATIGDEAFFSFLQDYFMTLHDQAKV
ncbi:MAG TPA: M1 family metallopeptidase, partial [Longilinea sp.]|nr:M1 family metallopeptidase [Longilinea sp.]